MVLTDGEGGLLAVDLEAANHVEVNLVEPLVDSAVTDHVPQRLVYDRAADSDPLRERLAERSVELVCPHRKGRVRKPTQDGRSLRCYRRRWKVERTIASLRAFKRLIVRNEFYPHLFHEVAKLACLMIWIRRI